MSDSVSVVLVGIGGYGEVYLSALLDEPEGARCRIVGAVDPEPGRCRRLRDLETRGVPVLPTLDDFYREHQADLAVISSPIHLHSEHVFRALAGGSHVLVEKPAAASSTEVDAMIEARERAGRFVAVGFQWSFARGILDLKRDLMAGRFGASLGGRALTLWPRNEAYYRRNDWAGRRRDPDGRWILDSPASNAMAHHLHNLLFLLGPTLDRCDEAVKVTARTARVNDIETFDTIAARIRTAGGAELLFLASHTIAEDENLEPRFLLELEGATVSFAGESAPIQARLRDVGTVEYPSPHATPQVAKLWDCVDAVSGGATLPCGLETSRPHVAFIEAIEASGVVPWMFPEERVRVTETAGGRHRWVKGLAAALEESYQTGEWPELLAGD